jgi:VWFA-related protein
MSSPWVTDESGARWRRAGALALVAVCASGAHAQRPFVERVDVSRVLIDARVLDEDGRALIGLRPEDFVVNINGDSVRVESVEWVDRPGVEARDLHAAEAREEDGAPAGGRLIVVLVQKDLEPIRVVGLMRMMQLIEPLLGQLTPDDRAAVLSFDSHLKIWTDFTADVGRVRRALREDLLLRNPPPVSQSEGVSLLARLDPLAARRARGFEDGLRLVGEALELLPGAKAVVLLGHGFGRFNRSTGGVTLMDGYDEAREALQRARAAVFTLNVTQANYNSLQAGLQSVSAATGGFYASTYEFPVRALARVVQALEGHYVLFADKPAARPGRHRIEVRLAHRRGDVFARSSYVD